MVTSRPLSVRPSRPPGSFAAGTLTFTAPADTILTASTTYALLVVSPGGDFLRLGTTTSDGEDTGGADGWTIANNYSFKDTRGTWTNGSGPSFRITITGSAVGAASTDATLSGLTVTGGGSDLVTFVSGTYEYDASVANTVDEVTVTPTLNDTTATIEYLDGNDATITDAGTADGQQVTLTDGDNVIKVKVTAADKSTSLTYTVTVNRAAAATTCTLNTDDIWCGVVTVEAINVVGAGLVGYGFSSSLGALSDTGFSVGTNPYTIDSVWIGTGSSTGALNFSLTSDLTDADEAKLALHVGSASFAFSDADGPSRNNTYIWLNSGLYWSSTSSVTLRLREAATPPDAPTNFTATVGDTQVALAWKAAALDSGVTRHEFRFKTDGSYPLTWTAIANSGPDEANEDSFTVTGLTNEEAHTFELRAVNAAGGGDAAMAGPVTPTPGICDRTQQVHEAIVGALSGVDNCAAVTVADLAGLTELQLASQSIDSLKSGDFAGLTSVTFLNLANNSFTTLLTGVFSDLTALQTLVLAAGGLTELPAGVFSGLTNLTSLNLSFNALSSLPGTVFSDLTALSL